MRSVVETEDRAATVEAVDTATTRLYLAGPVPWRSFVLFLALWSACAWAALELRWPLAIAATIVVGAVSFWLLVPKRRTRADLKGWTILPLAIAFCVGIALGVGLTSIDEDLVIAAYGIWFSCWLQLGLWLQFRGPVDRSAG